MIGSLRIAGPRTAGSRSRGRSGDRIGDGVMYGLCLLAALLAIAAIGAIAYQMIHGASASISHFGLGFLVHATWQPNPPFESFGAGTFLYGTAVTSAIAMLLSVPLGISIAVYLAMVAPRRVRGVIGPLGGMLGAGP